MNFRIATWNMNYWQRKSKLPYEEAWQFLDLLNADVTLIQEAVPPKEYPNVVWNEIDKKNRPWGSGSVSRKLKLTEIKRARSTYYKEEVNLLRTWHGCVAIAEVNLPDDSPLTLISCYGLIDESYAQLRCIGLSPTSFLYLIRVSVSVLFLQVI
jgi:hypothetical protein